MPSSGMKLPAIATALLLVVVSAAPATASPGDRRLDIDVLSSRADQVTGSDALIRVSAGARSKLDRVRLTRNGVDVTGSLTADPATHTLTGVVGGLREGWNVLIAFGPGMFPAVKFVRDHGNGPIFSGPRQYPFLCRTESADLGQPVVDNQEGQGYRVLDAAGAVTGWSRDCGAAAPVHDRLYRATNGQFK
jgi:hypothetical protein